jgi:hypothetical protein
MDSKYNDDSQSEQSYVGEDQELELLGWPRCLSAVPADVMDLIDDSETES